MKRKYTKSNFKIAGTVSQLDRQIWVRMTEFDYLQKALRLVDKAIDETESESIRLKSLRFDYVDKRIKVTNELHELFKNKLLLGIDEDELTDALKLLQEMKQDDNN